MPPKSPQSIIVYTDGSSLGNPGPGGYGCVIAFQDSKEVVELGDQSHETTNNKMELTAILKVLEYLRHKRIDALTPIIIYTDSSYAINGITKWIAGWERKGWITMQKTPVLNSEIWKPISELAKHFKKLKFEHVRGHAGVWGNERCDYIATEYARGVHPKLFKGSLEKYDQRVIPGARVSPLAKDTIAVSQGKKTGSGKAYSYVSVLAGKVMTHPDWESCKARVYGKSAKFKKVLTKEQEIELIQEWSK